MELLKLLSTSQIVAQIISFLILFFLLRAFAWKKLLKLLDERKERIAADFKKIEEQNLELEKIRSDYQQKLQSIDDTAKAKIREAVMQGQSATEELIKIAKKESDKILQQARDDTKRELSKAKEQLKDEIADLVLDATEHLLKEKMTEDEDKKIVRDFLDKVG